MTQSRDDADLRPIGSRRALDTALSDKVKDVKSMIQNKIRFSADDV